MAIDNPLLLIDNVHPMSLPTPPPTLDYRSAEPHSGMLPPAFAHTMTSILGPFIGLLVVVAIFGIWKPERFLTVDNLVNVLTNNYHYAVAAVGMTFVIITAGIDLSVGSTMALSCVCCAMAIKGIEFPPRQAGPTIGIGVAIAMLVGLCVAGRRLQAGPEHLRRFRRRLRSGAEVERLLR